MIPLFESFSAGVRQAVNRNPSSVVFTAFSAGIGDKRYPRGSNVVFQTFSCGTAAGVAMDGVRFIRKK